MDDPLLVRGGEAAGELERVVEGPAAGSDPPARRLQGLAFEQLETTYGTLSWVPTSWTARTFGWLRAPAARASRSKRRSRSGRRNSPGRTLIATSRLEARVTGAVDLAHARRPGAATTSYGPSREPSRAPSIGRCGPSPSAGPTCPVVEYSDNDQHFRRGRGPTIRREPAAGGHRVCHYEGNLIRRRRSWKRGSERRWSMRIDLEVEHPLVAYDVGLSGRSEASSPSRPTPRE